MPRTCTVCSHPDREAIDRALVESTPNRRIAARFRLAEQAVRRHKAAHLAATLVQAQDAHEVARADDLLDQVRSLQAKALGILDKAEKRKQLRTALAAIREARGTIELLARLTGELREAAAVNVAVGVQVGEESRSKLDMSKLTDAELDVLHFLTCKASGRQSNHYPGSDADGDTTLILRCTTCGNPHPPRLECSACGARAIGRFSCSTCGSDGAPVWGIAPVARSPGVREGSVIEHDAMHTNEPLCESAAHG